MNVRDMLFEPDDVLVAYFRGLTAERRTADIAALWDLDRRWTGAQGDRCHEVLMLACDVRDDLRRAEESMLDAVFPTVNLGEVTEDGPEVDSSGDQGGLPE
ncbi:hypothetical protein ACFV9C_23300 [Kribbella sp. NPDC059898]|uniref:hypothetical protein n=1 Tax=Kribbella sp. NPDC059898 TaxID=3346995 RepID=UPI00365868F0